MDMGSPAPLCCDGRISPPCQTIPTQSETAAIDASAWSPEKKALCATRAASAPTSRALGAFSLSSTECGRRGPGDMATARRSAAALLLLALGAGAQDEFFELDMEDESNSVAKVRCLMWRTQGSSALLCKLEASGCARNLRRELQVPLGIRYGIPFCPGRSWRDSRTTLSADAQHVRHGHLAPRGGLQHGGVGPAAVAGQGQRRDASDAPRRGIQPAGGTRSAEAASRSPALQPRPLVHPGRYEAKRRTAAQHGKRG
eukprot:scaffold1495_cov248-Pinguiococcus_pyrenoidosus.AAC.3